MKIILKIHKLDTLNHVVMKSKARLTFHSNVDILRRVFKQNTERHPHRESFKRWHRRSLRHNDSISSVTERPHRSDTQQTLSPIQRSLHLHLIKPCTVCVQLLHRHRRLINNVLHTRTHTENTWPGVMYVCLHLADLSSCRGNNFVPRASLLMNGHSCGMWDSYLLND